MTTLADLHRSVQATLTTKRLGPVVFVRYLLQTADKPDLAPTRLAQLCAAVRDWTGQPLDRLYALGTPKSGQVTLTLEFAGGATALVSWSGGASRGLGVDLTVLGNHGAAHHDAGTAQLYDEPAAPPADVDKKLVAWIDRALKSGQPEGGGKS